MLTVNYVSCYLNSNLTLKLKESALKEKCLMTEALEKALVYYEKYHKN